MQSAPNSTSKVNPFKYLSVAYLVNMSLNSCTCMSCNSPLLDYDH